MYFLLHSLSMRPDGQVWLCNKGLGVAGVAREVWSYEHQGGLFSDICSSVHEGSPGHYLVACSSTFSRTSARLLAVDTQGRVAFDYGYPTTVCDTVFAAEALDWHDLRLR